MVPIYKECWIGGSCVEYVSLALIGWVLREVLKAGSDEELLYQPKLFIQHRSMNLRVENKSKNVQKESLRIHVLLWNQHFQSAQRMCKEKQMSAQNLTDLWLHWTFFLSESTFRVSVSLSKGPICFSLSDGRDADWRTPEAREPSWLQLLVRCVRHHFQPSILECGEHHWILLSTSEFSVTVVLNHLSAETLVELNEVYLFTIVFLF